MVKSSLVTGACGFIGSHLCEALLSNGERVFGVDCLTDLYDVKQKQANLRAIQKNASKNAFQWISEDLLQTDLSKILNEVDVVYHLAGEPGVRNSWGDEFKTYLDRNILTTQKLLENCKGKNIKKFVFASSSSVYGNCENKILKEGDYCRPYSPYGVTKLAAENLCLLYADNFQVPTVALRYFTVFGPRQRPDMAFHKFFRNSLEGKPLTIFGDGTQSRDFTYVSDAVSATRAAGEKGQPGTVYNVGGGCPATVLEVLSHLEDLMKPKTIDIQYAQMFHGDVHHTRGDIQRARKDLAYHPQVNLLDGLKKEFSWVLEFLKS